jgi:hypothetical protein
MRPAATGKANEFETAEKKIKALAREEGAPDGLLESLEALIKLVLLFFLNYGGISGNGRLCLVFPVESD